jgi:hypothetical protein
VASRLLRAAGDLDLTSEDRLPNLISCEQAKRILKTCGIIVPLEFLAFVFSQLKNFQSRWCRHEFTRSKGIKSSRREAGEKAFALQVCPTAWMDVQFDVSFSVRGHSSPNAR